MLILSLMRTFTYMFACDIPHISNIHDPSMMPDNSYCDGVFTHFRGYIAIYLDAKFFQHQEPCRRSQKKKQFCQDFIKAGCETKCQIKLITLVFISQCINLTDVTFPPLMFALLPVIY